MELWNNWFALVNQFRAVCTRERTFFCFVTILIYRISHFDILGVNTLMHTYKYIYFLLILGAITLILLATNK